MNTAIEHFATYSLEIITPEIATQMLKNNTKNRRIRTGHVNMLAHAMAAGEWMETGQGIGFDWNGDITDGQHRLHGVIQSGVSISILVIRMLDPKCRKYTDRGAKSRSAGDSFYMAGCANPDLVAAATKLIHRFAIDGVWRHRKDAMWPGQYDVYYKTFPAIQKWSDFAMSYKYPNVIAPSLVAGLGMIFEMSEKEPGDAELFMDSLVHGIDLSEDSPLLLLRNRLIRSRYVTEAKLTPNHTGWLVIKAWNLLHEGKTIKQLVIRANEQPPSVVGFDPSVLPYFGQNFDMPIPVLTLANGD